MKFIMCMIFLIVVSCAEKHELDRAPINKRLIFFDSRSLSELGNDDYERLLRKVNEKINVKYLDDIIYVTNYVESNACGAYSGDIRINNGSIQLVYKLVSEEGCSSTMIDKVIYIIDNPKQKRYKFSMKFE